MLAMIDTDLEAYRRQCISLARQGYRFALCLSLLVALPMPHLESQLCSALHVIVPFRAMHGNATGHSTSRIAGQFEFKTTDCTTEVLCMKLSQPCAISVETKHELQHPPQVDILILSRLNLQLVLVLIERRWVGLETLPLPNVQSNHCRLVAITQRVLQTVTQNKPKEGQHWQAALGL